MSGLWSPRHAVVRGCKTGRAPRIGGPGWRRAGAAYDDGPVSAPLPAEVPLRDVVREEIRRRIAEGTWRPGTRLVERDLAEEFAVSRVPVREALRMLQSEGFVAPAGRGMVVRALSRSDVEDLFDLREALEVLAARLAAERADDAGLAELRRVLDEGRDALAAGDHDRTGTANTAFHETLVRLSGNAALGPLLEPLTGRLRWLFRQTLDPERVYTEHQQLFAALSARDAEQAAAVALAHVRASRHMVLDELLREPDPEPVRPTGRSGAPRS